MRHRAQPLRDAILAVLLKEEDHCALSISRALDHAGFTHSLSGLYKALGKLTDDGLVAKSRPDASEEDVLALLTASLHADLNVRAIIDHYPEQYYVLMVPGRVLAGLQQIIALSTPKRPTDRRRVQHLQQMIEHALVATS